MTKKEHIQSMHDRASEWADAMVDEINEVVNFQGKNVLRDTDTLKDMVRRRLSPILNELGDNGPDFVHEAMEAIYPVGAATPEGTRGKLGGSHGTIAARVLGVLADELEPSLESFGELEDDVRSFVRDAREKMRSAVQAERVSLQHNEGAKSFARRKGVTGA